MTVKVGLVGIGTVGGGCVEIIQSHKEDFQRNYGLDLELARVCSIQPEQAEQYGLLDIFTNDFNDIINDPEIDIVVELIGGTGIAKTVITKALEAGKNVVTANKAIMATSGQELINLAAKQNVELQYEASVGGGIPILDPLKHCLNANGISSVMGIVNGTTNYMLTRMAQDGMDYDTALAEAQAKGFAEANPTADVDGFDAAAKAAILSTLAFHSIVSQDDVHTEGIRQITPVDLQAADQMGYVVKLLAIGNQTPNGIDVRVHPTMLPKSHQLATVNGVMNAIYVIGDYVGETMFFGAGAGSGPAASAVMGDVLEVARHINQGLPPMASALYEEKQPILPIDELETRYYIRFHVADRPGVLAKMAGKFADHNISVHSVSQHGGAEGDSVDVIYVTHTAKEAAIRACLADVAALEDTLRAEPSVIRVQK